MEEKKKKLLSLFKILLILILVVLVSIFILPYVKLLNQPQIQKEFQLWVDDMGILGWLILLGVQFLQVVVAFLPGEPVELMAGVLYGGFGGLFLCLVGIVLGTSLIFYLSKKFGRRWIEKLFKRHNLEEFSFLHDSKKLEIVVFLLFLVPGTPKDMLTYFAGTTSMTLYRFLLITVFARIPSVITSTFMGASVREGNWKESIVVFAITGGIGVLGILLKDRAIHLSHRLSAKAHHIRRAKEKDADQICQLMKEAHEQAIHPDLFVPDDRDFILDHMEKEGLVLCEMRGDTMAGFVIIRFPEQQEDQLGYDLGYTREQFARIAHLESIVVKKEYQGKGIQIQLIHAAEEELFKRERDIILATVDPENRYSLDNFEKCGYQIRWTGEKYGGKNRHIVEKKLTERSPK